MICGTFRANMLFYGVFLDEELMRGRPIKKIRTEEEVLL
jgi:hypothetical protein